MPSAGGAGLALPKGPKWLVPSRDAFKGIESSFVGGVGGAKSFATRYGDDAGRGIRGLFNFGGKAKAAPKPGGVRPNPVQVGDDVVRAVNDVPPSTPMSGRAGSRQFPTSFVVKSAVVAGGAAMAPTLLDRLNTSVTGAVGPAGPAGAAGDTVREVTTDIGEGLGAMLANLLGGAGVGAGTGVYQTLSGVGEGLKKVMLPALLLGGGFLVFTALKK